MNLDSMSEEELKRYENELLVLKNALVDVSALRTIVEMAKVFDSESYTIDSYNRLIELVKATDELFVSGTPEKIKESINKIDTDMKALEFRVNKKEPADYINSIEDIDLNKYTEESVTKYNKALSALKTMLESVENTTATEFVKAKNNFELPCDSSFFTITDFNPNSHIII